MKFHGLLFLASVMAVVAATTTPKLTTTPKKTALPSMLVTPPPGTSGSYIEAKFMVTFESVPRSDTEYVVFAKNTDGGWVEVAKTQSLTDPLQFTASNIVAGSTYTIHMKARGITNPADISGPSNESSIVVTPLIASPTNVSLKILLTVTVQSMP